MRVLSGARLSPSPSRISVKAAIAASARCWVGQHTHTSSAYRMSVPSRRYRCCHTRTNRCNTTLASTGESTPPTQWVTCAMVTLRVGGVGSFPGGDAVPDRDVLWSDEDVLDQEAQNPLPLDNFRGLGVGAELGEEAFEVVGEFEVGVAVGQLGVEGLDLVACVGFPCPQVGHPAAQFVEGDQLFGVCLDHAGDRG